MFIFVFVHSIDTSHFNLPSSTPLDRPAGDGFASFFFQPTTPLPTAKETMLGDVVMQLANAAVQREVQLVAKQLRKHKAYTMFTAEWRANIGRYASKHGNAAAVKMFKADFEGGQLGESVCLRSATSKS